MTDPILNRISAAAILLAAAVLPTRLAECPHSDGNACEQYRIQGQRCQNCPLINT